MYQTSDFRKGLILLIDKTPYVILDFQHYKPGKGNQFTRTKLRNLISGSLLTHTEVIVDEKGPILIESASRLSGGLNRGAINHVIGLSLLDLLGHLIDQGPSFVTELAKSPPRLKIPLWQMQFISRKSGTVKEVHMDDLITNLQSKCWVQKAPKVGDSLDKTIDLFTSPGLVFMSHRNQDTLEKDYKTIRRLEQENRLFVI